MEGKKQYTFKEKLSNFLYYYKWHLIIGAFLLFLVGDWIHSIVTTVHPDYQVGVITEYALPQEASDAIQSTLEAQARDLNGDGKIVVKLRAYTTGTEGNMYNPMEVALLADLSTQENYFLITDDPEGLQAQYQVLANPDGPSPAEGDFSVEGKVYPVSDLLGLDDPLYDQLYVGRRDFAEPEKIDYYEDYSALWDQLIAAMQK